MDMETHENKGIHGGLGRVNQGWIENSSSHCGNSSNSDNSYSGVTGVSNENICSLQSSKGVVNQEMNSEQGIGQFLSEGTCGYSSNSVNEVVIEINTGEIVNSNVEAKDLGANKKELGSRETVKIPAVRGARENGDQVEQDSNGDSSNSINGVVLETVTVMNLQQNTGTGGGNGGLELKSNGQESSPATVNKSKAKVPIGLNQSSLIDIKGGGGGLKDNWDGERVCRICHLNSDGYLETTAPAANSTTDSVDLIQLGCGCKDELGIAHTSCAEAWFKLKGNRICEICGETARNVTVVGDYRFLERRLMNSNISSENNGGCWRGQPFCNFLMACLVVAFVLPWFFRVNMF